MTEPSTEERIDQLLSSCRSLDEQIEEAQKDAGTNTEKELIVRPLTAQKEQESAELAAVSYTHLTLPTICSV